MQYAALPWRVNRGELEILLITTLKTRRWIVPKGWPGKSLSPQASAAREALEEAGVVGTLSDCPVGAFPYFKFGKRRAPLACLVEVFALAVSEQRRDWDEKDARELRWCSVEHAMALIDEPGLRHVIARFAQTMRVAVH
jgi:8-oxo-dGTP pyrophosphatase MutT (NUDIX family)